MARTSKLKPLIPHLLALTLVGCSDGGGPAGGDDDDDLPTIDAAPAPDALTDTPDAAAPDAAPSFPDDPFGALPDTSEGLTNVSADLNALLENGALKTVCADYAADPGNRKKRLLCGKAMFFYEGFGTAGVPAPLVKWLIDNFPDDVGPGFSKLGMIPDPSSPEKYPLGLGPGAKLGQVDTLAFTCASCHFGQLPDGRYAVGAPNHAYDYGRQNLVLMVLPALAIPGADPAAHHADALASVQPLKAKMDANPLMGLSLIGALLPILQGGGSAMLPTISKDNEGHYAHWKSGTMDFFIQPLPFDDGVHTVSKISALWDIPTPEELEYRGISSHMLGWTGGTLSLLNFVREFVYLGGGTLASWPDAKLTPLADYIYSLRAPQNPSPPPVVDADAGEALFATHCLDCHDGPRGSGRKLYGYDEIGVDEAMKYWVDGDLDGMPDNGIYFEPGEVLTHKIKSPRLVGLWAMKRFLHNGSIDSLDALLCLGVTRPTVTDFAYGDGGHTYGCALPEAERRALIAYLLSH